MGLPFWKLEAICPKKRERNIFFLLMLDGLYSIPYGKVNMKWYPMFYYYGHLGYTWSSSCWHDPSQGIQGSHTCFIVWTIKDD